MDKAVRQRVDSEMQYGQVRPVSEDTVEQRMLELERNPPGVLLRLTVWQEPGIFCSLFLPPVLLCLCPSL